MKIVDSLPIYLQISQFIENEILNGNLESDNRVPSTNEFAKTLDINPATAGRGLNELADQGILYKQRGLGMFVSSEALEIIIEKRQEVFIKDSLPRFIQEAKKIGLGKNQLVELIKSEYVSKNNR